MSLTGLQKYYITQNLHLPPEEIYEQLSTEGESITMDDVVAHWTKIRKSVADYRNQPSENHQFSLVFYLAADGDLKVMISAPPEQDRPKYTHTVGRFLHLLNKGNLGEVIMNAFSRFADTNESVTEHIREVLQVWSSYQGSPDKPNPIIPSYKTLQHQ